MFTHATASSLGGSNTIDNLTVQKKSTNRGCYRSVEIRIKNLIQSNVCDSIRYCVKLVGNRSKSLTRTRRIKRSRGNDWPIKPKLYRQEYQCIKNGVEKFFDGGECKN